VKIKCFNRLGVCAVGVWCLVFPPEANAAGLAGGTAQGVEIAEYGLTDLSPVAKIHADRIFTDYERHGFFRIGLLPILVVENVELQISAAGSLTNALSALREWRQPSVGIRRLELRNLEITIVGEAQPRLRALRARISNDSSLELFSISLPSSERQPIIFGKGSLQIAGSSAGRLFWKDAGRTDELFPLNPKIKEP
jgi:hypothetical protein